MFEFISQQQDGIGIRSSSMQQNHGSGGLFWFCSQRPHYLVLMWPMDRINQFLYS
jgi:hypothetical protein